jgi:hypothetical protein
MGKNKDDRIKLDGLLRQIARHEYKVIEESLRHNKDEGLIKHWQTEIRALKARATRLQRRLPGRK